MRSTTIFSIAALAAAVPVERLETAEVDELSGPVARSSQNGLQLSAGAADSFNLASILESQITKPLKMVNVEKAVDEMMEGLSPAFEQVLSKQHQRLAQEMKTSAKMVQLDFDLKPGEATAQKGFTDANPAAEHAGIAISSLAEDLGSQIGTAIGKNVGTYIGRYIGNEVSAGLSSISEKLGLAPAPAPVAKAIAVDEASPKNPPPPPPPAAGSPKVPGSNTGKTAPKSAPKSPPKSPKQPPKYATR